MHGIMITDWIQAIAALLTMSAAIIALIIAAKAPKAAARFAEDFRSQSAAEEERRRFQMTVFTALMKCRMELLNIDARSAVNLVDVAFADSSEVVNARRLFLNATEAEPSNPQMIIERYHSLTEAVSRAMGFGDRLTAQDIRTGWYPRGMGQLDEAAFIDAEEKIARRRSSPIDR